jgi:hypothetical protein
MPDLAWNGITMGKKICDFAHAYDILVAPHNCHSPINTLVSAAVAATIPNFFILEFDQDDAPWRDDLMTHPLVIEKGVSPVERAAGVRVGFDRAGVAQASARGVSGGEIDLTPDRRIFMRMSLRLRLNRSIARPAVAREYDQSLGQNWQGKVLPVFDRLMR